jgi:legumain
MKLIALAVLALAGLAAAENYAVIVAGSRGYGNYRHHADVCHSYKIVTSHGIDPSRVVLIMYDDVAQSSENPFPGQLFNKPTDAGTPGVDVYAACKDHIDYKGEDATAANFLAVLKGDKSAVSGGTGRVLESGADDKVFINFADHGGTGLIAMPAGPYLYAQDLIDTLKFMHDNQKFSELVFYMEACESGSMFDGLLKAEWNIFATTAANPDESSWGTYCPPDDKVNGKELNTCLGDLYSVNWMEDSDAADMSTETLEQQFTKVKQETDKSHVMQYGSTSFDTEPIGDFQTEAQAMKLLREFGINRPIKVMGTDKKSAAESSTVDSRDIPLVTAFHTYLRNPTAAKAAKLVAEIEHRETVDKRFAQIDAAHLTARHAPRSTACHKAANEAYEAACGRHSDYSLKYVRVLVNMCESMSTEAVVKTVSQLC